MRLIADAFQTHFQGQIMASEQPDLVQACSARNLRSSAMNVLGLDLERVKYGLAVYVAIAVEARSWYRWNIPAFRLRRPLDELPPQRPGSSRETEDPRRQRHGLAACRGP